MPIQSGQIQISHTWQQHCFLFEPLPFALLLSFDMSPKPAKRDIGIDRRRPVSELPTTSEGEKRTQDVAGSKREYITSGSACLIPVIGLLNISMGPWLIGSIPVPVLPTTYSTVLYSTVSNVAHASHAGVRSAKLGYW